ncbi:ArnT family glycosyltransferase [Roseivirga echinicomitans]
MLIKEGNFNRNERGVLVALLLLMLCALFVNLGIYPLYLEEPRRGLIALEMTFQDNLLVPTQTGDLYYRKPPFYNWLIILSYQIFGGYSEFATRIVSVVSALLTAAVIYKFFKTKIGNRLAVYSALSYVACVDILFYFSMIGEIDLFYALITFLVIVVIYHFGKREQYWSLFLLAYSFSAIGFLTKGLTSLPFLAISLLVFFIYEKKFKMLFSLQHIVSILVFFALLAGYFYAYSLHEDPSGWYTTLFSESAEKAVGGGFSALLKHVALFPFITMANLLPVTFFIPILFVKRVRMALLSNRLMVFFGLLFIANFVLYWFSVEAKSRYIYPLFPLIITFLLYGLQKTDAVWVQKYGKAITLFLLSLATLVFPAMFFVKELSVVDHLIPIVIGLELLMIVLWWLYRKKGIEGYMIILGVLLVLRLGYSFTVPVTRQKSSGAAEDKALGLRIAEITKGESLHRLGDVRMSLTIVYYIEAEREAVLYQTDALTDGYYFVYTEGLPATHYTVIEAFHYHNEPIYLIRVNKD